MRPISTDSDHEKNNQMGRKSSVLALPDEILSQLDQMIMRGRLDHTEITRHINALLKHEGEPLEISRSALARYAKGLRDLLGVAADYPMLLTDGQIVNWLLLTEIRRLRESIETMCTNSSHGGEE